MQTVGEFTQTTTSYSEVFERLKENFYLTKKNPSLSVRIKKLKKIKNWILLHEEEIIQAIQKDLGKPEIEAKLFDIKPVLMEIDLACNKLRKWARPIAGDFSLLYLGATSKTLLEPLGVVLILAPWNFPFNLSIGPLVSAIASGNNVVLKPSELSSETTLIIERMINESFPANEIKVITGDASTAVDLLKLPFNHIFFTGSPAIGKKVMEAASKHLASVTLELGGCNPAIVDNTADLQDAAEKIIYGKFINAGQSCLSVNTLYIDKAKEAEFTQLLLNELKKRHSDNPQENISHIINKNHLLRIVESVYNTKEMGAIELTNNKVDTASNFLPPIILNNVSEDSPLVTEEIFGPVLPIVTYYSLDELILKLQQKAAPLALYIFSKSKENTEHIIQSTSSGTVAINETTLQFGKSDLPFGGINNSGIGKAHGYHGFLAFSNQRAVLKQRVGFTLPKLLYPPYNKSVKKMVDFIYRYL